jgi:hypothetical protein
MWVAAALVVVAAGGGGAYLALRPGASPDQAATPDSVTLAATRRADSVAAVTPPAPTPVDTTPLAPEPSAAAGDFGTIVLRAVPRGATVLVDGRPVSSLQPQVRPGRHTVEINAPGYAPFSSPVFIVRGGRQPLTARMQTAESGPGPTVVATGAPAPGTGGAQPSPAGGQPTAAAAQAQPPTPSPQPAPQQAAPEPAVSPDTPGQLMAASRPVGRATLNGSPIARWPAANLPLLPGTYRLNISAPGFEDSAVVFVMRPGQTYRLGTINLRRSESAP